MSKKRKTRKEKVTAQTRHDFSQVFSFTPTQIKTAAQESLVQTPIQTFSTTKSHAYVKEDIRNTVVITSILAVVNIALFLILKFQFVNLFGIKF